MIMLEGNPDDIKFNLVSLADLPQGFDSGHLIELTMYIHAYELYFNQYDLSELRPDERLSNEYQARLLSDKPA